MSPADGTSKSARGSPADRSRRGGSPPRGSPPARRTCPQHGRPQDTAAQPSAEVPPNIPNIADEAALIEERLRGAGADLKDCVDGRHGHGAKAQRIERAAAESIASACGRLRVLVRYLRERSAAGRANGDG